MYSLYRAWFGAEETYPRLETLSPPDTLVRVGNDGEHQFVAHRGVLAAHSGYLKALLASNTTASSNSGREEPSSGVTSVCVSSVGGEAFAPLLNYMYTGRLEVTLENIYSVLLATHLLHMPGALEQCRAALLRLRGPPPPLAPSSTTPSTTSASTSRLARPGTILRPVPNRVVGPPLCWPQSAALYPSPHVGLSHLPNFPISTGALPILSNPAILREPPTSGIHYSFRQRTPSPPSEALELRKPRNGETGEKSPRVETSPSFRAETEDRETSIAEDVAREKDNFSKERISVTRDSPGPTESNGASISTTNERTPNRSVESPRSRNEDGSPSTSNGNGVVYDIACCDGPVRFHRVLNENYVSTSGDASCRDTTSTSVSFDEEEPEGGTIAENDENGKPEGDANADPRAAGSSTSNGSYTCGYCRHTFKSHYCYRKHARRHLLPSPVNDSTAPRSNSDRSDGRRREVKLLDLNVQYYPCKICGSKFPSYYFVHKHKKLCHGNIEENPANNAVDGDSSSVAAPRSTGNSCDNL